jgi:DeoR/GlpR family transcriptional regulator of sugar metabolism
LKQIEQDQLNIFTLERRNQILKILDLEKRVFVSKLAKQFCTSEATIRRDLRKLEKQNLIRRTYGGALLIDGPGQSTPIDIRTLEHSAEKNLIAKMAASFVENSDTIILDASTTSLSMVDHLQGLEHLRIITNCAVAAIKLTEALHQDVYCAGGKMMETNMAMVGQAAIEFVSRYSAQKLFLSCWGISPKDGLMDLFEEEANLKRAMIARAEKVYLLCDSSKFGRSAFCNVTSFESIDYLITDAKPDRDLTAILNQANVQIVTP